MKPKIRLYFDRLNDPGLIGKARAVLTPMTNNAFFPEPYPDYVSSLSQINETVIRYEQAYLAGLGGEKQKIAARKIIRKELIDQLTALAGYCELVAKGNLEMLASTGFDIRTATVAAKGNTQIPVLSVKHGHKRGMVIGRTKNEPRAASYQIHINAGNPAVETDWMHAEVFAHGTSMTLENLVSGKDIALRVRYVLSEGYGPWSNPVFFMPT